MREAGLPRLLPDEGGGQTLVMGSKGVVRAIYPETNRVDIETEDGGYLTQVLVLGPYFPEVHTDGEAPAHVVYLHVRGQADAFCWPETHRRLLASDEQLASQQGAQQPERRYFPLHGYILRWGKVTIRISRDHRFLVETEEGDYVLVDTDKRQIELCAPTVFVGTEADTRVEVQRDTEVRVVMPNIYLGKEAIGGGDGVTYHADELIDLVSPFIKVGKDAAPDTDGLTYSADTVLHLVSPLIKLTAESIVLDPTSIKLGHANAAERVLLGDAWMALYNAFVALFNGHTHSNVQNGPGTSGPPTSPTPPMTDAVLSDVARVSKTGS